MKPFRVCLATAAAGLAGLTAQACLQFVRPEPPTPQQLPADLFKVHVHVVPERIAIEVPLIGGGTAKIENAPVAPDPKEEFLEIIKAYENAAGKVHTFAERNDYGASLVYCGRAKEAIAVLVLTEADFPGEYATASNLGTAYELAGDVDNALRWIRIGIERNPKSHSGTEWLHVAILEAKLELQKDPHWLDRHSVLDGQQNRGRAEQGIALEYQLNERLYFIRENDPIMCDLFYQAAVLADDPAKKAYFLKQVPRFGEVRHWQLRELMRNS